MLTEFDLIEKFFTQTKQRADVLLGVGDDAALLQPPAGQILVATTDTLITGVHFPEDTDPVDIGYKTLAVNLSDLAAMGAEPAWVMLALTLPQADIAWLTKFRRGFFELIDQYNLQLVGGDITRGSLLVITVEAFGFVSQEKALRRSGARVDDRIYVTGTLGDAGLALELMKDKSPTESRLNRPTPRISTGLALRDIASSCIDISDGLAADLTHILKASNVGARINVEDLPLSPALKKHRSPEEAWKLALSAGDDYELCFTVPPEHEAKLIAALKNIDAGYTHIGNIEAQAGLRLMRHDGTLFALKNNGFRHF